MKLKLNLTTFRKKINKYHPSIKYKYEMSKTEINFLDTTMFKIDSKPRTKVFLNQPNDSYLHSKSEHPNSTMKVIACRQALRFNKICCNRRDLHNNCKRLLKGTLTQI